jgi:hypothetical protein
VSEDPKEKAAVDKAQHWEEEINAAEKELKKFHDRARAANRRFVDEREAVSMGSKWFNVYYANTNILESALYAQLPKPAVSRKFTDYNDEVGRVAALIIERSITQDLDDPSDTFDSTMRHCTQDRLIPGLAQAWLRLETDTEEISIPPTPGNDADYEEGEAPKKITDQRVCVDYIFWEDFLWSPCRVWEERRWVGRRAYMTREGLIERFGEAIGKLVSLDYEPKNKGDAVQGLTPREDILKKAVVYEIWDRETRKVVWFSRGYGKLLDERTDPLGLTGFDPCPKPMLANITTSNTVPRPDYYMLQDQYNELDTINNRISLLIRACKVVGVYDKSAIGVARMLKEGFDNELIPVDNWAMFAEKGGLKGQIDWLPLEMVATSLRELNAAREVIKGQIYELTGIADIVRGASKASETLGAQQIKAQFASVRIKKLQDEVARFASEIMRIKAELMIKHFTPELIVNKSGVMATDDAPLVPQAIQLLQNEAGFEWRIQVNADTMSQADYAMEKQDRIEFMSSISKFLAEFGPMLTAGSEFAPIMIGLLKWSVAGFRGARDIEGMLDRQLDQLSSPQQQNQPEPPDPEVMAEQARMQLEQAKLQQEAQLEQAKLQQSGQLEQAKLQQAGQLEQAKLQQEVQLEEQRTKVEIVKIQQSQELADLKVKAEQELAAQQSQVKLAELALKKSELEFKQAELASKAALEERKQEDLVKVEAAKLALEKEIAEAKLKLEYDKLQVEQTMARETAQANVDASSQLQEPIKKLTEAISKPKTVVRDDEGRVSGVK